MSDTIIIYESDIIRLRCDFDPADYQLDQRKVTKKELAKLKQLEAAASEYQELLKKISKRPKVSLSSSSYDVLFAAWKDAKKVKPSKNLKSQTQGWIDVIKKGF
jgi:hypothetical protein